MHLALVAKTRKQVDEFYRAAIAMPVRRTTGRRVFARTITRTTTGRSSSIPNGVNLEAVCHAPVVTTAKQLSLRQFRQHRAQVM